MEPHVGLDVFDAMTSRGWSVDDLAFVLGVEHDVVARVLAGVDPVEPLFALMLGVAFGVSADSILALQHRYALAELRANDWFAGELEAVRARAVQRTPDRDERVA